MTGVEVTTGSRLHFGLLCGAPHSGWHYGGIGMMVDQPTWQLNISPAAAENDQFDTSAAVRHRLEKLLLDFRRTHHSLPAMRVSTTREVGFHTGLGSGTQLTLAAGAALLLLSGAARPASIAEFAETLGRSRRSAIGTFGFDHGGFIIDHGKSPDGTQQPLERLSFPPNWRMLILTPRRSEGLSGETEERFFGERRFLNSKIVAQLDSLIHSEVTPAIRDGRFHDFRDALAKYGGLVGEYYGPVQGGVFSSTAVRELVAWLQLRDMTGTVQSSWGPSVCIPRESPEDADRTAQQIRSRAPEIAVTVARGLNAGAAVRTAAPERHRSFG